MATATTSSFYLRHEFLIRRLHSLSGLIPVGAFMVVHLLTNASVVGGPDAFQNNVDMIHRLGPILGLVEWTFVFLPLIFHAVIGVVIVRSGRSNTSSYAYPSNVRYMLQRATAWIALFFIAWHVFHMHGWLKNPIWLERVARPGFGAQFDPHYATSTAALAMASMLVKVLYAVGVLACVYHLANGIWTMGMTWGVWTSPAAQRRADYVCTGFGVVLGIVGLTALFGFSTVDVPRARAIETVRHELHERDLERIDQLEAEFRQQSQSPADDAASRSTSSVR